MACGFITVSPIEALNTLLFSVPEGLDFAGENAMTAYIAELPTVAFAIVVAAHALGALIAGFIAALIAREHKMLMGLAMGVLFLAFGISNLMQITHPMWFMVLDVLEYIPFTVLGSKLVRAQGNTSGTIAMDSIKASWSTPELICCALK